MAAAADKDEALKRLGGGRWQTRDERFSIEPQSGTWVIVDAEQTDDLGLPLVRGPFPSLGAAKAAIAAARTAPAAPSPLPDRAAQIQGRSTATPPAKSRRGATTTGTIDPGTAPEGDEARTAGPKGPAASAKAGSKRSTPVKAAAPPRTAKLDAPAEPRWIADLDLVKRRRARRLLERLTDAGAPDPEGIVRRDVVGDVPAAAAFAVVRQVQALGTDASAASIARVLVDGGDDAIGVRWRLVDGDGRPITLDPDALERRTTR